MRDNKKVLRVNKDLARKQFFFSRWGKSKEKFILEMRDKAIKHGLDNWYTVIVDDTNLNPKHEERMQEIANEYDVELEVKFINTWPATCHRRNYMRSKVVPHFVIDNMYSYIKDTHTFFEQEDDTYQPDTSLNKAVIFDIDGTLATMTDRMPYEYWEKLLTDKLNTEVKRVLDLYNNTSDIAIIIFTGRKESKYTPQRLEENNIEYDLLLQRGVDDDRKDSIVKREMFDSIKDKYHVLWVFDDRDQVVSMWRSLWLQCFQVNYWDF